MTGNQPSSKNHCEFIISQAWKSKLYFTVIYVYVLHNACTHYETAGLGQQFNAYLHNVLLYPSPYPHNKHSNVQLHFLSVQITAARHDIKTDCAVGVTAVGYTGCDILAIVDDPVIKSDSTVS